MGTDIGGAIEVCPAAGCWEAEIDLLCFQLGRDYDAWNALFDVRGTECLERPLFAGRGLPDDVSEPVRENGVGDYQHSHTYATWAEVAAVDWDAPLADRPAWHWAGQWLPGEDGELALHDAVPATTELGEAAADTFGGDLLLAPSEWPPGGEVRLEGVVYRPVVLTARMLAPPDEERWARVWKTMRDLAAEYGDENVRLVVWFG
ncbi:hypothetical protein OIE62_01095 [Streptomyces scopuliridis]|uniref:Uncharacterized protein n=1 Tax=Streptomyces scopuliridis TaxID=452529 RepID=A0ACD4ZX12_9ACTN|nr:hypothetical protein [Streptomyces scopuliridis]WSB38270.1 hypothetical protein OG949_39240 [Streptomyces scopuliridis]WSC02706.1 hypothetical protein OG835_40740 [Streptomyces scopuliridis]WSC03762.1 hypothetical protein OIE62_01095 [Streptomyces scopuliridis]